MCGVSTRAVNAHIEEFRRLQLHSKCFFEGLEILLSAVKLGYPETMLKELYENASKLDIASMTIRDATTLSLAGALLAARKSDLSTASRQLDKCTPYLADLPLLHKKLIIQLQSRFLRKKGQDDLASAIDHLAAFIQLWEHNEPHLAADLKVDLGWLLFKQNRIRAAKQTLNAAAKELQGRASARLGDITSAKARIEQRERLDKAEELCKKSISYYECSPGIHKNRCRAHVNLAKFLWLRAKQLTNNSSRLIVKLRSLPDANLSVNEAQRLKRINRKIEEAKEEAGALLKEAFTQIELGIKYSDPADLLNMARIRYISSYIQSGMGHPEEALKASSEVARIGHRTGSILVECRGLTQKAEIFLQQMKGVDRKDVKKRRHLASRADEHANHAIEIGVQDKRVLTKIWTVKAHAALVLHWNDTAPAQQCLARANSLLERTPGDYVTDNVINLEGLVHEARLRTNHYEKKVVELLNKKIPLRELISAFEQIVVEKLMAECDAKPTRVATILGIGFRRLKNILNRKGHSDMQ